MSDNPTGAAERGKKERLTMGSLFAGFGGIDLGFQWAGIDTVWQVECDGICLDVLERAFPEAERFNDVATVGKHNLDPVDIIAGGFPCQGVSSAGRKEGLSDPRSALWSQFKRIIEEMRPAIALIENVASLRTRGLVAILQGLASIGYDAEWDRLSAAAFGAPHIRKRMFIFAYPQGDGREPRRPESKRFIGKAGVVRSDWWEHSPGLGGMVHGIPKRAHRVDRLGNAVVPQVAEYLAKCVLAGLNYEKGAVTR